MVSLCLKGTCLCHLPSNIFHFMWTVYLYVLLCTSYCVSATQIKWRLSSLGVEHNAVSKVHVCMSFPSKDTHKCVSVWALTMQKPHLMAYLITCTAIILKWKCFAHFLFEEGKQLGFCGHRGTAWAVLRIRCWAWGYWKQAAGFHSAFLALPRPVGLCPSLKTLCSLLAENFGWVCWCAIKKKNPATACVCAVNCSPF